MVQIKTNIELIGGRFMLGIGLVLLSIIKIIVYKRTDCINPWFAPQVCGEGALYYYYLYIGVFIFGLILIITSFKKKKGGDNE